MSNLLPNMQSKIIYNIISGTFEYIKKKNIHKEYIVKYKYVHQLAFTLNIVI